jgi:hypothetical protein
MLKRDDRPRVCSYLLRCWEERGDHPRPWRFSLEDIHSGERHGFASLALLVGFIETDVMRSGSDHTLGPAVAGDQSNPKQD